MKTILTILILMNFICLFGQDRILNDVILFSATGDTILLSGGRYTDTNKVSTTSWRVVSRSGDTDTLKTLSYWNKVSNNGYYHLDSISEDTLSKYNLIKEGQMVDVGDIKDFKIVFNEKKTSRGKKDKYDKNFSIKSCMVDFAIYYKDEIIMSVKDWETMYFSEKNKKITTDKVVELFGWKLTNPETYLIVIKYTNTRIKKDKQSSRYYHKWKIL